MSIDRHVLAAISLAGLILDVLGALYLAYELLGGAKGALSTLTRVVTYSLLFGAVYATALVLAFGARAGVPFGLIGGTGLGLALGLEFRRLRPGTTFTRAEAFRRAAGFGAFRGLVLGLAGSVAFGPAFGVLFGVLTAAGLLITYRLGASPSGKFVASAWPSSSRAKLIGAAERGIAAGLALFLTRTPVRPLGFGIALALVVSLVGAVVGAVSPVVEYWSDHLPATWPSSAPA